ncbi:MAG TPA: ABC transporter permease, partial [Candidatus Omnitrophica bacterium]|nr:ABC transporter permease [Candidatus Omnitrophota bacterium]
SINALDVIVRGIFYTSSQAFDDHYVRLPLSTAQRLLHTQSAQALVVFLERTEDTPRVRQELERLIRARRLDVELRTWDELSDFYTKTKAFFSRLFFVLKLVIAIIAILSIYNTMNMAVVERTTEIGTIMALGLKRRRVLWLFLCEGGLLGILGGIAGLAAGIALTWLVSRVGIPMPPPPGATITWHSEPLIDPPTLVFAFGLSLATALISSWYPAQKASRLEIAEALRHS